MSTVKKGVLAGLLLPLTMILYLLLFPLRLTGELSFTPEWYTSLDSVNAIGGSSGTPFYLPGDIGGVVGYVSSSGDLVHTEKVFHRVVISSEGFISYGRTGGPLILQSPEGYLQAQIGTEGYPIFRKGGLYIFTRDRRGVSRWSLQGERAWFHNNGSIITSIDVQEEGVVVGALDGTVWLIDPQGTSTLLANGAGSIYACAISPEMNLLSTISGVDPQLLSVYSLGEGESMLLWSRSLPSSLPRSRYLSFWDGYSRLVVETPEGLEVVDWRGKKEWKYPMDAALSQMELGGVGELSFAFGRSLVGGELLAIEPMDSLSFGIRLFDGVFPASLTSERLVLVHKGGIFSIRRGQR